MKNYYQILGVPQNTGNIALRKAYRKQSLKLHPDVNKSPDAHEKFLELSEAYQVLKDPTKRRRYDYLLKNPAKKPQPRRQPRYEDTVSRESQRGRTRGSRRTTYSERDYRQKERQGDYTFWGAFPVRLVWSILQFVLEILFRILIRRY